MKKFQLILAAFFFISALKITKAEDSPFNFLRYVSDARAASLAGCFVSMPNDASAIYYNPAAVYTVEEKKLSFTFLKHVLDINSGNASYMYDIPDHGKVTAFAGYTNYGTFDEADDSGNITGAFGANDLVMGVSYTDRLDTNLYYGATLKYIYANIDVVSTTAMAVDAGLFYEFDDDRTTLGLSMLNAGAQLSKISNTTESIPLDIRLGMSHRLKGLPVLFNFSFHHLADESDGVLDRFKSFAVGGEISLGDYIKVRLGYDNLVRTTTASDVDKGMTGISAGLGLKLEDFDLNYGASVYGASATLHRFSVNYDL